MILATLLEFHCQICHLTLCKRQCHSEVFRFVHIMLKSKFPPNWMLSMCKIAKQNPQVFWTLKLAIRDTVGQAHNINITGLDCTWSISMDPKHSVIFEPHHEKICFMPYVNHKGANQPAHPRSLISAFVVPSLSRYCNILLNTTFQDSN